MSKILFYKKKGCPNCHKVLNNINIKHRDLKQLDIDTVVGKAEAAYYDVKTVPCLLIMDKWFPDTIYDKILDIKTIQRLLS
jgi:glutaredoxin